MAVRDHFLIHYILSGKGLFEVGHKTYYLEKGQGFLICPGTVTFYKADTYNPWIYTWVGFHGLNAESYLKRANLTIDHPIFFYESEQGLETIFKRLVETKSLKKSKDLMFTSLLYHLISLLIDALGKEIQEIQGRFLN